MQTPKIYGNLPSDLGFIDISPKEMMYWLYCPIKQPKGEIHIPSNLKGFKPIVDRVQYELTASKWENSYIYVTAKRLWVNHCNTGNRPGWHSDGFLTEDLNYIWYDSNPTVFFCDDDLHSFTKDHDASLIEMDNLCEHDKTSWRTYGCKHLLRLDQTVLHKVDTSIEQGYRTFVKISVSNNAYALEGNSINEKITLQKVYNRRGESRNCPQS